jgi:hypothetical protein
MFGDVITRILELLPMDTPGRRELSQELEQLKSSWDESDAEGRTLLWRRAAEAVNRYIQATPEQAEKIRQLFFGVIQWQVPPDARACGNCQHWITDCVLSLGKNHALGLNGAAGACVLNPPIYIGTREGEPLFCPPLTRAQHGCSQFTPRTQKPPGCFQRDVEKVLEKIRAQSQIARPVVAPSPLILPGDWKHPR